MYNKKIYIKIVSWIGIALMLAVHVSTGARGYIQNATALAIQESAPKMAKEDYYVQNFIISAYYSPLAGQNRYATGSYEADLRLNGNGTHGADGTPVYPGMIAAPKTYAFGTKMDIPGIGIATVHDRGGAIVKAGERGHAYDRLDVWMGHGDEGLKRALQWGKRTVEVKVYGVKPEIADQVYLEGYSQAEQFVQNTVLAPMNFPKDLYYGESSDSIKKMQEYLVEWSYLNKASGFYGDETAQAIFSFQVDFEIVSDESELGAGHFGIKTRSQFEKLIKDKDSAKDQVLQKKGENLLMKYPDLSEAQVHFNDSLGLGDSGENVVLLQNALRSVGYLKTDASGYFDTTTEHAVFKFQQSQKIVSKKTDQGAGYFGPSTRMALNNITQNRYLMKTQIAQKRSVSLASQ